MQGFLIGDCVELTAPFKYIGKHGPQVIPPGTRGRVVNHNRRISPLVQFESHVSFFVRADMLALVDGNGDVVQGGGFSWDHYVRLMREAVEAERIHPVKRCSSLS